MDPEKFKNQTKKVAGTISVDVVSIEYLSSKYEIRVLPNNSATATGLLEVAKIEPKNQNLPEF